MYTGLAESDNIFGPPGNAYTSLVFDLEFPDISAARRAHIKFKVTFVDIGHWTVSASETGGAAQGAATTKANILHFIHQTPSLPPSQFRLDIRRSRERFCLACFCGSISRYFGRAASALQDQATLRCHRSIDSSRWSEGGGAQGAATTSVFQASLMPL
ncbi:hypothetical protein B0H34DRAFT_678085 [Crassisporium funariophilum]|nr:hypothetical protein B0H34DRAFT_678085 [Crassisporium funariophilum]